MCKKQWLLNIVLVPLKEGGFTALQGDYDGLLIMQSTQV